MSGELASQTPPIFTKNPVFFNLTLFPAILYL